MLTTKEPRKKHTESVWICEQCRAVTWSLPSWQKSLVSAGSCVWKVIVSFDALLSKSRWQKGQRVNIFLTEHKNTPSELTNPIFTKLRVLHWRASSNSGCCWQVMGNGAWEGRADWYAVGCNVGILPDHHGEVGTEPETKVLNSPSDSHSNPHLWSWAMSSEPKNEVTDTSGQNESLMEQLRLFRHLVRMRPGRPPLGVFQPRPA